MKKTLFVLAGILLMLVGSCEKEDAPSRLGVNEIEEVLYEYYQLNALQQLKLIDLKDDDVLAVVLQEKGIKKAVYDSSMQWYLTNNDVLYQVYERVEKRLQQRIEDLGENVEVQHKEGRILSNTGDTANIWRGSAIYLLQAKAPWNRLVFKIPTDTLMQKGDKLTWNFNLHYLFPATEVKNVMMQLTLKYKNDSVETATRISHNDGDYSLSLTAEKDSLQEIYGHIYMNTHLKNAERYVYVTDLSLIRYKHKPDTTTVLTDSVATLN